MKLAAKVEEYRKALATRHPDTTPVVEVVERRGWIAFPTGLRCYLAKLRVSGEGFRTITATMNVEEDGTWSIR